MTWNKKISEQEMAHRVRESGSERGQWRGALEANSSAATNENVEIPREE